MDGYLGSFFALCPLGFVFSARLCSDLLCIAFFIRYARFLQAYDVEKAVNAAQKFTELKTAEDLVR